MEAIGIRSVAMTKADGAGTFRVGGEIKVNQLGFSAMRITGPGIWGPLTAGGLARNGTVLDTIAKTVMFPIPGTSKVSHFRENVAAAVVNLDDTDFMQLDQVDRAFV
jgi:hypothetical protein